LHLASPCIFYLEIHTESVFLFLLLPSSPPKPIPVLSWTTLRVHLSVPTKDAMTPSFLYNKQVQITWIVMKNDNEKRLPSTLLLIKLPAQSYGFAFMLSMLYSLPCGMSPLPTTAKSGSALLPTVQGSQH
jgi:hypothetical protein